MRFRLLRNHHVLLDGSISTNLLQLLFESTVYTSLFGNYIVSSILIFLNLSMSTDVRTAHTTEKSVSFIPLFLLSSALSDV